MKKIKIGFIGYGLIGKKRSKQLPKNCDFISFFDPFSKIKSKKRANSLEEFFNSGIDIVVISTPHKYLSYYSKLSIKKNKHTFIEKPGAMNLVEIKKIYKISKRKNLKIAIGYNHRFHPGIIKAHELFKNKSIGELIYIRAIYGHGGRLGYQNEWRFKKDISGGGELLDQGSHIIDLIRIFEKKLKVKYSNLKNYFWKSKNIEDNAFCVLGSKNKLFTFHVSWTEWKNKFNFEIFGKKGKIEILGLGRSYGKEIVNLYKMKPNMKKPNKKSFIYLKDNSFNLDFENFVQSIIKNKLPENSLENAIQTMKIIDKIYKLS